MWRRNLRRAGDAVEFTILRGVRPRTLLWLLIPYAAGLWWLHSLVRQPLNLEYFQSYVSLRCSAEQMKRFERPVSYDEALALEKALRRCQGAKVEIDGVWGGIDGEPSVRLKVRFDEEAEPELKHYSVGIDPLLGIASIRYTTTPVLYYLNY